MFLDTVWNAECSVDDCVCVNLLAICLFEAVDGILVNGSLFHVIEHGFFHLALIELTKSHNRFSLESHVLGFIFFFVSSQPFGISAVSFDFVVNVLKHLYV